MARSKRRKPKSDARRRRSADRGTGSKQVTAEGLPVRACFGDRCLDAMLLSEERPPNEGVSIELLLTADELHRDPPDLATQLRVYHHPSLNVPDPDKARFGGYVTGLEAAGDGRWLLHANNMANWSEYRIPGWGLRNHQNEETVYTMARAVGMPHERIHIRGWNPTVEPMMVVVPVEGMACLSGVDATDTIALTPDPEVLKQFAGLGPDELQEAFAGTSHRAVGIFEARTMFDAERQGVYVFGRVLRRLALAARYTSAEMPGGDLRDFHRARLLEQLKLRPIAGVVGLRTKRMWLRGYALMQAEASLDAGVLAGVGEFIGAPDQRTDEAIEAWRRATLEPDASVAVIALAEAIEFYVGDTKVPRLFTEDELAAIREGALANVDEARRQRVVDMVGKLNEPSVNMRLRAAMDADQVRYSESEFSLLARFRGLRNKIIHGQERKLPSDDELRQALALVDRLLLVRLRRVRRTAQNAN